MISMLLFSSLLCTAIMRRNIEMSTEEVVAAVNNFDMNRLRQDYIEVLLRIMPGEEEIKKYKDYDREKRPVDVLTDEDKFLLQVGWKLSTFHRASVVIYLSCVCVDDIASGATGTEVTNHELHLHLPR